MRAKSFFIYFSSLIISMVSSIAWAETITVGLAINTKNERIAFSAVSAYFSEKYPRHNIDYYAYAPDVYQNKLSEMTAGKKPLDVVMLKAGTQLYNLASENLLHPEDSIWKSEDAKFFNPDVKQAVTYQGHYYAVPFNRYFFGLYYNKNIFTLYGLEQPENWEQFLNTCSRLKKFGYIPLVLGGKGTDTATEWFSAVNIKSAGSAFHSQLITGKASFFDERAKQSLTLLKLLADKGFFVNSYKHMTKKQAMAYLYREKAAMALMRSSCSTILPDDVRNSIGFMPFPYINPSYKNHQEIHMDSFAITAGSKNKEAASDFLRFMMSADTQSILNKYMASLPANSESITDDTCSFVHTGRQVLNSAVTAPISKYPGISRKNKDKAECAFSSLLDGMDINIVQSKLEAIRLERAK